MRLRLRDPLEEALANEVIDRYIPTSLTVEHLKVYAARPLVTFMEGFPVSTVVGAHLDSTYSDFNRMAFRFSLVGNFSTSNLPFVVSFLFMTFFIRIDSRLACSKSPLNFVVERTEIRAMLLSLIETARKLIEALNLDTI